MDKFSNFLNSLKDKDNQALVEAISTGYQAIFEYPTTGVGDKHLDFYVEDIRDVYGEEKTLEYVTNAIESLKRNETIRIPHASHPEHLKILKNPQNKIENLEGLLLQLNEIKKGLEIQIQKEELVFA